MKTPFGRARFPGMLYGKTNRCSICKTTFETQKPKIVFHDVVECLVCGHIWVLDDLREYRKYL